MQCIRPPYGVVYVAGKKHYFGVGGGTRQFKHLVEDDGTYLRLPSSIFLVGTYHSHGEERFMELERFMLKHPFVGTASFCELFVSMLIYTDFFYELHA